ncbi:hypothetical protein P3S68_011990 [Capsicum galapagoense]
MDRCSKGNPSSAGGGGLLGNYLGKLIMTFTAYFGSCSNNLAKIKAIIIGMKWCLDNGYCKITVESDSLPIIQMITEKLKSSWQLKNELRQISTMKSEGPFQFMHTLREGNTTTDLVNLADSTKRNTFFNEATNLPTQIISTLKNDIKGSPKFRIRVKKGSFIFDLG